MLPDHLIILLPAMAFAIIALFFRRSARLAPLVSIAFTGAAVALALALGWGQIQAPGMRIHEWEWAHVSLAGGAPYIIKVGTLVDPLAAMMLGVVSFVSLLVQVYSLGYMKDDPGLPRYYLWLSLFTASMLALVLAPNLFQIYMAWELVGLCSYLLIGFWWQKDSASSAAKKAFVVNRVGDFGFFLGILALTYYLGTGNFSDLPAKAAHWPELGPGWLPLGAVALLVFMGAVGKSAQFPLHVWLPDAMEGPTPVSALIHAATMVAAGVYLIARTQWLFDLSALSSINAPAVVAYVGGFTALFAALAACAQQDIKKVLAYSTLSQLGYMVMALGCGGDGSQAGPFHLFTHAWFKALLFLGAGSVIHALHGQDIRGMGGLWKKMPVTAATFLVGCLAISGIPPLAGFFSKDMIIDAAYDSHLPLLFPAALLVAFLTAFYMFRLFFLTFMGESRDPHSHAHESPPSMLLPLILLAVMAFFAGFVDSPWVPVRGRHYLAYDYDPPLKQLWAESQGRVDKGLPAPVRQDVDDAALLAANNGDMSRIITTPPVQAQVVAARPRLMIPYTEHFNVLVFGFTLGLSLLGILSAWLLFSRKALDPARLAAALGPLPAAAARAFYVDEAWGWLAGRAYLSASAGIAWFDRHVVDGFMNLLATASQAGGQSLRRIHSGQLQAYALAAFASAAALLALAYAYLR
jgi:NADH-quinone oxidoreductase subunit L